MATADRAAGQWIPASAGMTDVKNDRTAADRPGTGMATADRAAGQWIPASAGMTDVKNDRSSGSYRLGAHRAPAEAPTASGRLIPEPGEPPTHRPPHRAAHRPRDAQDSCS